MMDKCLECHATLTPQDTACFTCGSARREKNPKPTIQQRGAAVVKVMFIVCAILTAVSLLFGSYLTVLPSFMKCLAATVILMLVDRSADQMLGKQKG